MLRIGGAQSRAQDRTQNRSQMHSQLGHTIKPGTPQQRTMEHGTPAEQQNPGEATENWRKNLNAMEY